VACIFFITILAETNRTPFDLPEAEAELVAGYNLEYSSIIFALFFLGEYNSIIVMSAVFSLLFLGGWSPLCAFSSLGVFYSLWFGIKIILCCFLFIVVRATLPRYRYDQLMAIG
jgi:NADH-quinone oxidoreductase subunit H